LDAAFQDKARGVCLWGRVGWRAAYGLNPVSEYAAGFQVYKNQITFH
jgi:hypothetical protein